MTAEDEVFSSDIDLASQGTWRGAWPLHVDGCLPRSFTELDLSAADSPGPFLVFTPH